MIFVHVDATRAYFNAPVRRNLLVQVTRPDGHVDVHRLRKAIYGTKDAAVCWEQHYRKVLMKAGYAQGRSSGCV